MQTTGHILPRRKSFATVLLAAAASLAFASLAAAAETVQAAADLQAKYAAGIESLAKWCESNGLAKEAKDTRRVLSPTDPYKIYVAVLPSAVGPAKLPADAPAKVVEWQRRLWRLRREQGAALFDLARKAAHDGHAALGFEMAHAALEADPDYEAARRLFGFQKVQDQWRTAYEAKRLRSGYVWSDRFGWLPKGSMSRYEHGERYCDGRWISAADDARRHADIRKGWNIETEHYTIRTNRSLEAGVALGVKLERLHRVWRQLFLRYYASDAEIAAMFDGRWKAAANSVRRHIVYFRNRQEYDNALRSRVPNIAITSGMYRDDPPCAYFFAGEGSDDRSTYHEATHQLFYESRPVSPEIVRRENFWIVEGIALLMESLRVEDGYCVLGGMDDDRMYAARHRLLVDHFYVPLDTLVGYDMARLQQDPQISKLYSQSTGLTYFLMFDDGGRYRDALVQYLCDVYAARADHETLARLTGQRLTELDKQYRIFVEKSRPADEAAQSEK
ncbi:MAG: hypothetical protein ABFC96_15430 [Thermoguttaceae bacterium]